MSIEERIRELIYKSDKEKMYHQALGISNERMVEICKLLDERTKNKKLIFEDMAWIMHNDNFTEEEKIMAILERNMRHAYFVFTNTEVRKTPYIKLHSTVKGALEDRGY
jgi:hypothetical protein